MRRRQSTEAGFTLVEAVVTMALASALLLGGAMALRAYTQSQALAGSVDQLTTALRGIQTEAMNSATPSTRGARFTPGSAEVEVVEITEDVCHTTGETITLAAPVEAVAVEPSTGDCGASAVMFFSRGSATEASIALADFRGEVAKLTVSPMVGRVEVAARAR